MLAMVQRLYAGLAVALIAAALLQAPFAHVHSHGEDHDHAGGFAHAHLGSPNPLSLHTNHEFEVELEAADEDESAVYVEWTPEAVQQIDVVYAEAPMAPLWLVTYESAGTVVEFEPASNGPPGLRLLPARSPPV